MSILIVPGFGFQKRPTTSILSNGLVVQYRLKEVNGEQVIKDSSINGYHGFRGSSASDTTLDPPGIIGSSGINFTTGVGFANQTYITTGVPVANLPTSALTCMACVTFASTATRQLSGPSSGAYPSVRCSGRASWSMSTGATAHATETVSLGSGFHIIAFTYASGNVILYRTGVQVATASPGALSWSPAGSFFLGRSLADTIGWGSACAYFCLYNRALTADEINTNYLIIKSECASRGNTVP